MNDDPRDRFKYVSRRSSDKEDIFAVWDGQKKIARENVVLESELREAKLKSKQLRKQLIKNKFGDSSTRFEDLLERYFKQAKDYFTNTYVFFRSRRRASAAIGVLLVFASILAVGVTRSDSSTSPVVLGDVIAQDSFASQELPREDPTIDVLTPNGSDNSLYDIARISPPGSDASYVFLDRHSSEGQIFRVTQQELPDNFELAKIATDFQATNVIQVDDTPVYHGFSEEGGTQTLIFSKDKKLIFIRSPQKFSDAIWAAYVASLK